MQIKSSFIRGPQANWQVQHTQFVHRTAYHYKRTGLHRTQQVQIQLNPGRIEDAAQKEAGARLIVVSALLRDIELVEAPASHARSSAPVACSWQPCWVLQQE